MNEKIAELLAALQAEGLKIVLAPESIIVRVGKLEVSDPDSPGTFRGRTRVTLDGIEFQNRLTSVDVRLAVNEASTATIVLRAIP
jgi:hypothetical protein